MGFDHSVIKVGDAIGCLDGTALKDRLLIVFSWVVGSQQTIRMTVGGVDDINVSRNGWLAISVVQPLSSGR